MVEGGEKRPKSIVESNADLKAMFAKNEARAKRPLVAKIFGGVWETIQGVGTLVGLGGKAK